MTADLRETAAPASAATLNDPLHARWSAVAWPVVYLALCAAFQFLVVRVPQDADTAYHVAVGRLIREHGILRSFPWTPFSWLATHYADKELLFHLLLAPLAGLDWITAAHLVGTLGEAAILTSLFLVLRAERVRFAGVWALLPLLASPAFVFRFSLVRPHLFSVALALVVTWAASRRRHVPLALASAVYPWAYVAWQLPLVLVGLTEGARLLSGRRPGWRTFAGAALGVAFGVVVHPNGWNLVQFSRIQLVEVLVRSAWSGRPGLELGDEFRAFSPREWLLLLAPAAAMAVAGLHLAWRQRREDEGPLALALGALAFGLLTVRTARFAEYFVPFSVAAFAAGLASLARRPGPQAQRFLRRPAAVVAAALLVSGAITGRETIALVGRLRDWPDPLDAAQAAALSRQIAPGAQVFTCQWGLTGSLMLALPGRKFIVALDPTFFAIQDPERYDLWYRLPREAPPHLARTIRERFGARYVACYWDERYRNFFDRLAFEPGVRTLSVEGDWNVYELRDP